MLTRRLKIIFLLVFLVASCRAGPTETPAVTLYPTVPDSEHGGEPYQPLVSGEISGVLDDTLFTFHIQTPKGWEAVTGTRLGNGPWEAVVRDTAGLDYIVTAEASGYVSAPISYTIHLDGLKAYVVENGQVTSQEAAHLDFHFDPIAGATPTK